MTTSRQEREFKRKKLEDLYLALHGFCTLYGSHNLVWPKVMEGTMDYNQALDIQLGNPPVKENRYHETALMLVNIYFPSLRPDLEMLLKQRDAANRIHREFKEVYQQSGPSAATRAFVDPFNQAMMQFDAKHEKLNARLFEIAKAIR